MSTDVLFRASAAAVDVPARPTPTGIGLRVAGLVLVAAASLPAYRLLARGETGLAGAATIDIADAYLDLHLTGLLLLVPVTLIGGLFVRDDAAVRLARRFEALLHDLHPLGFAAGAAALAALLTFAFTTFVLGGVPNHIDSLSQMLHAAFWADGRIAGPGPGLAEFWMIQNSVFTPHGWVSQYPPGHVAVLAIGLASGMPALTGALLVGATVFATSRFAERLVPEHVAGVRLGMLLVALSPFIIALGGSYMNHVTAAAAAAGAAWFIIRMRDGASAWGVPAGFLLGWCLLTRPLTALAIALALVAGVVGTRALLRRPAAALALAAGAAPPVSALLLYNRHFFGSPLRFGYDVALGPTAGLGFQRDPWGNVYGPLEALAYTSADLVTANIALIEAPLPVLVIIGGFLLLAGARVGTGVRALLALACAPVAANALYWHHGQFMGPRMLYETAPFWLALFGIAIVALARAVPQRLRFSARFAPRPAFAAAVTFALLAGIAFLAPSRLLAYGGSAHAVTRVPLPDAPPGSIVFVHDAWRARVGMRLAAAGMRLDSLEVVLRANPTCSAQRLADAIVSGDDDTRDRLLRSLDFRARGRDLPPLLEITPGNRFVPGPEPLNGECLRQARADRYGVLDLAPFLWRGTLPGGDASRSGRPLFVRDLGPELNETLQRRFPDRSAWVYTMDSDTPVLLPFEHAMNLLWRDGAP